MAEKENTISQRFEELLKHLRLNPNQFSKEIGKPRSTIQVILDGRSKPGFDFLELVLLHFPDINPAWLMTGEGEMFRGMANVSATGGGAALEQELRERIKTQQDMISTLQYTVELQKSILSRQGMGKSEGVILDRFALGNPYFFGLGVAK
ncbi:MAG: helix-turn-helix transcriptional regulator [Siphonobacter aquaeclarae]|nr:helix-turn-helix transcriptional regulator [Siphonobacter aquaeclarae]